MHDRLDLKTLMSPVVQALHRFDGIGTAGAVITAADQYQRLLVVPNTADVVIWIGVIPKQCVGRWSSYFRYQNVGLIRWRRSVQQVRFGEVAVRRADHMFERDFSIAGGQRGGLFFAGTGNRCFLKNGDAD